MKLESLKEIEYLYNNMTTSETVRLKPHLEAIEKELLELLPEHEENTEKLKAFEIIKAFANYQIVNVQGQWYLMQGVSFDKSLKLPITEEQAILLQEVLK